MPEALFLRACRGEAVERTPVWMMRQAGRYLPDYRAIRARHDFLTCCRTPELACELTLQPVAKLGVDAAILFSDILVPLPGMGAAVDFRPGPHVERPVGSAADVDRLRVPDPEESTGFVLDAIRLLRRSLPDNVPLIGFAGAPFTVAAYLVEGSGSKSFARFKRLLYTEPRTARALLSKCAAALGAYAAAQVRAGAQAFMLFDTWAGLLPPDDYGAFAAPYAREVFGSVLEAAAVMDVDVPRIYYGGESASYLEQCSELGANVIGIDWRQDLAGARRRLGPAFAVQGNLDPAVLLATPAAIRERASRVIESARLAGGRESGRGRGPAARGHVFNLGHGILPDTPPENARYLVDVVGELTRRTHDD